jgi:two-component system, chemotaxis family, CheB/CheR fusion protein
MRILVVDDNEDAAFALSVLLELEGHVVQQADDGVAGYEMAEKFGPQVGILDLDMPRRSGFELAWLIRKQCWGKSILLIALTGHDDRVARARATASGFDMFVCKPIDPGTFGGLIRRALTTLPDEPTD